MNSSASPTFCLSSILLTIRNTDLSAFLRYEASSWSTGVSPSMPSTTNRTNSADSIAISASCFIALLNESSGFDPMPPVSMTVKGEVVILQVAVILSLVTPGSS